MLVVGATAASAGFDAGGWADGDDSGDGDGEGEDSGEGVTDAVNGEADSEFTAEGASLSVGILRKSVARWEEWLRLGTGWQLVRWRA